MKEICDEILLNDICGIDTAYDFIVEDVSWKSRIGFNR